MTEISDVKQPQNDRAEEQGGKVTCHRLRPGSIPKEPQAEAGGSLPKSLAGGEQSQAPRVPPAWAPS